jgi:WD40 repeat protein
MTPSQTASLPPLDVTQTHQVHEWKHTSPLLGCRFDPGGRYVFAGAQDNTVQRWHLDSGKRTALTGHKSWVRALAFAVAEEKLLSAGYDGRLLVWPLHAEAPAPERTIEAHKGWVRALAVSPDGKLLASCGNDQLVKLWSVPRLTAGEPATEDPLVQELAGHQSHVYNTAFHPGGQHLASGDLKGVVKVWDHARGTSEREMDASVLHKYDTTFLADHGGIRGMAFNRDGSLLACAGISNVSNAFAGVGNPLVMLFDWPTGKQKQLLKPKEAFQGTAWGVVCHETGFLASVGGGNGGMLWFWKPEQPQETFALKLPMNARDMDLHPNGRLLALAFADGSMRIYEMAPKVPLHPGSSLFHLTGAV